MHLTPVLWDLSSDHKHLDVCMHSSGLLGLGLDGIATAVPKVGEAWLLTLDQPRPWPLRVLEGYVEDQVGQGAHLIFTH